MCAQCARYLPLSDESLVGSDVRTGLDSPLFSFCGGVVLLSKSSELSDSASSSQTFSNFCNVLACWSLYITLISWTIVTLQKSRCEHCIKNNSILSMLIMNKCQMILFCIDTAWFFRSFGFKAIVVISGICSMLRRRSRQLLMLSHCSNNNLLPLSKTFFICSTTARVARASVNDSLQLVSRVVRSKTVCRPISVRIITFVENKQSTGIVRLTKIRIIISISFGSLTFIRNGIKSFCTYWPSPSVRRNVRNVWSSHVNLQ